MGAPVGQSTTVVHVGMGSYNRNVEVQPHWVVMLYLSPNDQHCQVMCYVVSKLRGVSRSVPLVFLPSISL
jgi:hypothetical protein